MKIKFKIKYTFDKPTKQWVIYSKKYNISAYGKTKKKARKMFKITVQIFLKTSKP